MNTLVAIAYPNAIAADRAMQELADLRAQQLLQLDDAVIVERQGGDKVKLRQSRHLTAEGAAGGALWGGLIGMLLLAPLLGAALGAAVGAAGGAAKDAGVDDAFLRELGAALPAGHVALVLLVRDVTRDSVLNRLHGQYDGTILQTSLSADDEAHLRAAVAAAHRD